MIYLRRLFGIVLDFVTFFDFLFSRKNNQIQIGESFNQVVPKKIALYVAYPDLHNDVHEMNFLKILKGKGFSVIVIVNGVISIPVVTLSDFVFRKNVANDLGAIRDFFNSFDITFVEEVAIFNSSVIYLPSISQLIDQLRNIEDSQIFVGVESFQKVRHFQSFFFYAKQSGVLDLKEAFSCVRNFKFKRTLVNFGEIRISRKLISNGSNIHVLFPSPEISTSLARLRRSLGIAPNPTLDYAADLIRLGAPFLKRSNPDVNTLAFNWEG